MDQPYYGNGTKLLRLQEYITKLQDDEIVMFIDAYDVLIVADKEVILQKFLNLHTPFLMSAEKNCYPYAELADAYPTTSSPFRYINSGGFIGYVRNLKEWLENLSPFILNQGDQGQITKNWFKNQMVFSIDTSCEIFLSLYGVQNKEVGIHLRKQTLRCLTTGSEPCAVHANGNSFEIWNRVYRKLILR
jgi:hypothetical protein